MFDARKNITSINIRESINFSLIINHNRYFDGNSGKYVTYKREELKRKAPEFEA
jgi:hypothetical protein